MVLSSTYKYILFWFSLITILSIALPFRIEGTEVSRAPTFAIPIKCTLGSDCYIMHYVDLNPGGKEVDFGCGRQTYPNHDGTDFGIADMETMKRGIPVVAAASGVVTKVRNEVPDRIITDQAQRSKVNNIECGNGAIIDHGNGWQTQYCHMRNHSIVVKPGIRVDKGTILGMVGVSGLSSFPHLHFTVRHLGTIIDPFVGIANVSGCNVPHRPLWEQSLDYVPTGLIRAGFAPKSPTQTELWRGEFSATRADSTTLPALIFWAHLFGVLKGDREHFTLVAPDKRIVVDTEKVLTNNYRSWVNYIGKKNSQTNPLKKGKWRSVYQLKRDKQTLINVEREIVIE